MPTRNPLIMMLLAWILLAAKLPSRAYSEVVQPTSSLEVTGDVVQYAPDSNEFSATGNVEIVYKGAKLTCDRISVDQRTKVAVAEGHARLDDASGVIEGERIVYDLEAQTGTVVDARFRANPFFGKTESLEKVDETHFIARRAAMSTCSMDHPHYLFKSRKVDVFHQDKIVAKDNLFYFGPVPAVYLPSFGRSLKDPLMHVQVTPGSSSEWGRYVLSAWRYQVTDDVSGRIYFDVRQKTGTGQGFGTNYATQGFGKGDFKYYYASEKPEDTEDDTNVKNFERYFIRHRHKWDIDPATTFVSEYYKITDSKRSRLGPQFNVLKDYFPREYEKDTQPLSYMSLHRSFSYSSLDILMQKRTNRWYSQQEKLPEVTFNMPSLQMGNSRLYLENISSFVNLNQKNAVPSPSTSDVSMSRLETFNKVSMPLRVSFLNVTPFLGDRISFYDKSVHGDTLWGHPRSIFYSGTDVSTKFYRLFKVRTNFLKLDINDLRHVITPTAQYQYQHRPTIESDKLKFESIPGPSNSVNLGISNKLQTKRLNQKVDLVDFRISTPYNFHTGDGYKRGGTLSSVLYELDLLPYSWLSVHGDMKYLREGEDNDDNNTNYKHISEINYDIGFTYGAERSFSVGQRYLRKGGNEITYSFDYRVNPKWKVLFLQRYQLNDSPSSRKGLREQEYTLVRDLHCWSSELTYSVSRDQGNTIFLVFRLKAFPELQIDFNQNYHAPKPGAQTNQ